MAFVQPCFIRKNTPELREKLLDLGYFYNGYETAFGEPKNLYASFGSYWEMSGDNKPSRYEFIIDCGDNEELFIALASMTDDIYGINDYYIVIVNDHPRYKYGSIHKGLPISSVIHPNCYRKATVKELIEYFK